jgi:hypothetical protein
MVHHRLKRTGFQLEMLLRQDIVMNILISQGSFIYQLLDGTPQLSVFSDQSSAVSCQLSVVSCQLSVVSFQFLAIAIV